MALPEGLLFSAALLLPHLANCCRLRALSHCVCSWKLHELSPAPQGRG
jgi:hypothetical protein